MTEPHFVEPISVAGIAAALGPIACRFDVDVLAECGSTNTLLLEKAERGAPAGTVIVAERQTAGRGRLGRQWLSEPGSSLTFSLLWRFPAGVAPSGLSLAVGVAVAEVLQTLGVPGIALKWPNDVLRDGRKLGGILVELVSGALDASVIGLGVNLKLPKALPAEVRAAATTLDLPLSRNELLAKLLVGLQGVLEQFATAGFAALRPRWQALNAYAGASVQVVSEFSPPIDGRCMGVDGEGALLLEGAGGVQRIITGDVSLRPA